VKYIAINCAAVGIVRIGKSFTKHGINNMKVTKLLNKFLTNLWVTSNTASVLGDNTWHDEVLPSIANVSCFCLTILTEGV